MAVELTQNTEPGDLYVDDNGAVHRVLSFCKMPTITMENMATGSQTGGGIGCLNLKPFRSICDLEKDELVKALEWLSMECRQGLEDRIQLKEQVVDLKEQLADLKLRATEDR